MTDLAADTSTRGICASASQIFFVFDNLPDWQSLAAAVAQGAELVVLEGARDGLKQIAAHSGIDALHILSSS